MSKSKEPDRNHVYLYTVTILKSGEREQVEACNIWQAAEKLGLSIDAIRYENKVIL